MTTKKVLNGNILKTIALMAMLIDHIGSLIIYPMYLNACIIDGVHVMGELIPKNAKYIYWMYLILRIIGRIAYPIFAFMIVEGFLHTKDLKKYLSRLLLFAAISEVPYDIANSNTIFNPTSQNVLWTFAIALIMLWYLKEKKGKILVVVLIASVVSVFSDGGIGGILLIASMYLFKNDRKRYWIGCTISIVVMTIQFMWIQVFALLALFLLEEYNGIRKYGFKFVFYIFYPAHFLLLSYFVLKLVK